MCRLRGQVLGRIGPMVCFRRSSGHRRSAPAQIEIARFQTTCGHFSCQLLDMAAHEFTCLRALSGDRHNHACLIAFERHFQAAKLLRIEPQFDLSRLALSRYICDLRANTGGLLLWGHGRSACKEGL